MRWARIDWGYSLRSFRTNDLAKIPGGIYVLEAYSLARSDGAVSRLFRALPRERLHKGGGALTRPQHAVSVPIRLDEENSGKSARYVAAGYRLE
jgi:hypothetical protein